MPDHSETMIQRSRFDATSWSNLCEQLSATFAWGETSEVYVYLEAVSRCELTKATVGAAEPPTDGREGRFFDESIDVRWVRDEGGAYRAWAIREVSEDGIPARTIERRYYLLGEFQGELDDGASSSFTEGRYPGKRFVYPVIGAAEHDRAFVRVIEYRAVRPVWTELAGKDESSVEEALNGPMLLAHRFVGVGVGRDDHGQEA